MANTVNLAGKTIGAGYPVFTIAEIGINHNGDIDVALKLIELAARAGFDAVKFQKRTPVLCVPLDQRDVIRSTPWGEMTYMEYREKVEFGVNEYKIIDRMCKASGILWFASCWDIPSVDFIEAFDTPCFKIASACLTNDDLLNYTRKKKRPVILSTGMSTMDEIKRAVSYLDRRNLLLAHTTSTYPCDVKELNLRMIRTLDDQFSCPVGYSGHENGRLMTLVAMGAGAMFIERHITLDKNMWGSDQAASLCPDEFVALIKEIRDVERGLGDGRKCIYESEMPALNKLRTRQNCRPRKEKIHVSSVSELN
ncbi:MAG: N-acetylneuraminate synthase family protein [Proteobacteria bacterium]|nr:N-acetylneuraminate synthase family protein [Pseudomonadota bacterium]